jgi:CheY-like chemotaxis protein
VHASPAATMRILLVEDHDDSREFLRRLLRGWGYDVQAAGDMHAALALAQNFAFDLLLSDLSLPDGDGCELLAQLRATRPAGENFHAIALSGHAYPDDVRRSLAAGFGKHLSKPIFAPRLRAAIEATAASSAAA